MKALLINFLKSKTFKGIVALIAAALTAWASQGCGAPLSDAPPPDRLLCYAFADRVAQARVDAECRIGDAGVGFDECPSRDEILEQLQRSQEACK